MKTLAEFKQFVEEINLENGRNYKISILEKYKDNDNVKYYLHYLLNSYIVTGISEKKLQKLKTRAKIKKIHLQANNLDK